MAEKNTPLTRDLKGNLSTGITPLKEDTPIVDTKIEDTAPIVVETPAVTEKVEETPPVTTPIIKEEPTQAVTTKVSPTGDKAPSETPVLKTLDGVPLSDSLRRTFIKANELGQTSAETVEQIKTRLTKEGFDTSNFEAQYGDLISQYDELNQSEDTFFKQILNGETFGKFFEKNSVDYQNAKTRANNYNAIDKSVTGIRLAIKSGTLTKDSTLFKDLMQTPEYAEVIRGAQKENLTEKINNTKDLGGLTFGEIDDIAESQGDKYTIDSDKIKKDIEDDSILSANKAGYLESTTALAGEYKKRNGLRKSLRVKYPNASPAFIEAQYAKQSGAIEERIGELTEEATIFSTAYQFQMSEKEIVWNAEEKETTARRAIFTDLFNKKWGDDRLATQNKWAEERAARTNKDVTKWVADKDGNLTGVNKQGEVISTLTGYTALGGSTAKGTSYKQEWADKTGYSIVTVSADGKTQNEVKYRYDGQELIKSDYLKNLGTETQIPATGSGDNGYDVSSPLGTDIPAKSNVTVADSGFNKTFGNWVTVEDGEGNKIRYSHLQEAFSGKKGDTIGVGETIGQVGNTGNVLTADGKGGWRVPTEEELLAGKGAHIDIGSWDSENNMRSAQETKDFLSDGTINSVAIAGTTRDLVNIMGGKTALSGALAKSVFGGRPSDEESTRADKIIEEGLDKPYSQLKEELAGFVILGGNKELATNLKNRLRSKIPDLAKIAPVLSTLSDSIFEGRDGDAIRTVENTVIETVSENNRVNEDTVRFSIDKTNELESLIKQAEASPDIGPMSGTLESWLGKFKGTDFAALETKIVPLIAEMRNRLSGTAVTESETLFLEPLVPDIKDSADKFLNKLAELKAVPFNELNRFRNKLQLPSLNEGQVGNEFLDDRVGLYTGGTKQPSKFTVNNSSLSSPQGSLGNSLDSVFEG